MYHGESRTKQIGWLNDVANDLRSVGDLNPAIHAEEIVKDWLENLDEELPHWFDSQDRRFLVDVVAGQF